MREILLEQILKWIEILKLFGHQLIVIKLEKVRKLLCSNCNSALGMFNDNIEILRNAIDYLKNMNKNKWTIELRTTCKICGKPLPNAGIGHIADGVGNKINKGMVNKMSKNRRFLR